MTRKQIFSSLFIIWPAFFAFAHYCLNGFYDHPVTVAIFIVSAAISFIVTGRLYERSQKDTENLLESLHDIRYWLAQNDGWFYKNFRSLSDETKLQFIKLLASKTKNGHQGNSVHLRQNFQEKKFRKAIAGYEIAFIDIATDDLEPLESTADYIAKIMTPLKQMVLVYSIATKKWGEATTGIWDDLHSNEAILHPALKSYLDEVVRLLKLSFATHEIEHRTGFGMLWLILNNLKDFAEVKERCKEIPDYASTTIINVQQRLFEEVYPLLISDEAREILDHKLFKFNEVEQKLLLDRVQNKVLETAEISS